MTSTILPIHATLLDPDGGPLRAIGRRANGAPIWPMLGAEDAPPGGDPNAPPAGDAPKTFTQAQLDEIISRRVATEKARFADYDTLKAAKTELDQIKAANASDLEKAVKQAKSEGISEATTRANQRLVAAEARALAAAAHFHNPRDAAKLLDLAGVKVTDDGDVDADAIKALIEDAVKERPYLVKSEDKTDVKRVKRDPGQGPRNGEKAGYGGEAGKAEAERRFGKK